MQKDSEYKLRKRINELTVRNNMLDDTLYNYKQSISEIYDQMIDDLSKGNTLVHTATLLRKLKRLLK